MSNPKMPSSDDDDGAAPRKLNAESDRSPLDFGRQTGKTSLVSYFGYGSLDPNAAKMGHEFLDRVLPGQKDSDALKSHPDDQVQDLQPLKSKGGYRIAPKGYHWSFIDPDGNVIAQIDDWRSVIAITDQLNYPEGEYRITTEPPGSRWVDLNSDEPSRYFLVQKNGYLETHVGQSLDRKSLARIAAVLNDLARNGTRKE